MNASIELRHLRYFVTVAEELHFGRAARRLCLAQPPLSQQIRQLEEIVGAALFYRTTRSVSLTPAGEAFLERARRTLRNVENDVNEARSIGCGEVGSLNVGFVGSGMLTALPGIFRAYHQAHPKVHMHLHEGFTSRVIEGVENGTLDAGVVRDGDPRENLEITTILSEPFLAMLPATHPLTKQRSISAAELRNEPFVYYPRSAGAYAFEKPLTLCEEHGFRPQIVQEASHWLTILQLVGAGLGVSIAPACVQRLALPDVVCVPLRNAKVVSNIELACLRGESRPIVERFMQIAKNARTAGAVGNGVRRVSRRNAA
jgi:DNA-binding transcriptional LysR family regulator